ncbi:MAG: DUF3048 domain-containing protein [Bacilli bacterium]|nr:DUF3048 domain-containing protein [Bacilli bacterium]MDD3305095.1 DUF3048 domain-containing protein [Bacilli bacterium]MDD4053459.1 DUF3048 domain-containing protein [Bacilli bacterium]MDD4410894.1 DUF3048 domain-containing protein [Bacilli bacterium]
MDKKQKKIIVIIILILLLLGSITYLVFAVGGKRTTPNDNKKAEQKEEEKKEPDPEPVAVPTLKIIDLESKTRPIAIMIDNESGAWPQAGLQDAYLSYEIIVEGGISRILAIYKDKDTSKIGPVRSARHYYLDYALENDAIFTHFGFSPQAEGDIKRFGVNNISGTQADGGAFTRDTRIKGWQNVFTSISNLTNKATAKKYRTTSDVEPLLNYSIEEVDLNSATGATIANTIRIDYSTLYYVGYEFDIESKTYKRYMKGNPHVDRVTGAQLTYKNIIVYDIRNYPLNDGSGKGRQGLNNIGSGDGYYISNGYAIPIKWEKISRTSGTTYRDLAGNEIKVNDGNTFIHLQPQFKTLTIK